MELVQVQGFKNDINWIANRLSLAPKVVKECVARLLRLRILKRQNGTLIRSKEEFTTSQDIPSAAIREYNQQLLQEAGRAIDQQNVEQRDVSSIVMAMDSADLPKAKAMVQEFRREFIAAFAKSSGQGDSVFCLANQLFRIDQSD